MSRESKIGLLVATAFILVVGLLLSDHVTVATRQPPAPLAGTTRGIDSGLRVPGVTPQPVVLPDVDVPAPPAASEPTRPFVYEAPEPAGHLDVRLGHAEVPAVEPTPAPTAPEADPVWGNPQPSPLEALAIAQAQPVVPVTPTPAPPAAEVPAAKPADGREYVAQPGDTLGHLAARAFGRSTPENNAAIVALNPSLADDPDRIVAGRTYTLPTNAAAAAVVAVQAPAAKPAAAAEPKVYVVKPNDNLWRIAARALGDGGRHKEIVALNPGLDDPSTLKVGMKLRLPA